MKTMLRSFAMAALLGLAFSGVSTKDYVNHLDRQIHDISCSFIPGVTATQGADTGSFFEAAKERARAAFESRRERIERLTEQVGLRRDPREGGPSMHQFLRT